MLFFNTNSLSRLPLLGSVLFAGALMMFGAVNAGRAQEKVIKKAPMQQSDPTSGKAMYASYCAACHGPAGKGDGPAASELKVPPVDLTQLAKNNNGKFPADHVRAILDFGANAPAHGTNDMPVWGQLFRALDQHDQVKVNLRIQNLVDYVKTLQAN